MSSATTEKNGTGSGPLGLAATPDSAQTHMVSFPNILIYDGKRYPFNPNKIVFHDPKPAPHGGYVVRQEYELAPKLLVPITLQAPSMRTQWGISEKSFDGSAEARATLDLSFANKDTNKEVQAFYDVMQLWDAVILQTAIKRKGTWFKDKNLANEILQYLYHPTVRKNVKVMPDGTRKEYPDALRLRVQRRYGRLEFQPFDKNKNPLSLEVVKPDTNWKVLMQNTGLWFSSKSWTSSNRAVQGQQMPSERFEGYSLIDDPAEPSVEQQSMMVEEEESKEEN